MNREELANLIEALGEIHDSGGTIDDAIESVLVWLSTEANPRGVGDEKASEVVGLVLTWLSNLAKAPWANDKIRYRLAERMHLIACMYEALEG